MLNIYDNYVEEVKIIATVRIKSNTTFAKISACLEQWLYRIHAITNALTMLVYRQHDCTAG